MGIQPPFLISPALSQDPLPSELQHGKGKGTVHRRTSHEGPEGKLRYSSTLYLTSALEWGGWSTPRPGRFTPEKDPVPIV